MPTNWAADTAPEIAALPLTDARDAESMVKVAGAECLSRWPLVYSSAYASAAGCPLCDRGSGIDVGVGGYAAAGDGVTRQRGEGRVVRLGSSDWRRRGSSRTRAPWGCFVVYAGRQRVRSGAMQDPLMVSAVRSETIAMFFCAVPSGRSWRRPCRGCPRRPACRRCGPGCPWPWPGHRTTAGGIDGGDESGVSGAGASSAPVYEFAETGGELCRFGAADPSGSGLANMVVMLAGQSTWSCYSRPARLRRWRMRALAAPMEDWSRSGCCRTGS